MIHKRDRPVPFSSMALKTAQRSTRRPSQSAEQDHPSSTRRSIVGALTVLAVALGVVAVLWLSLSSRGFSVAGDAADQARIVVRGVESTLDTNIIDRSDIPWELDEVAHLVGWGSITLVSGFLLRARRSLSDIAVGVFGASFRIEILQAVLTTSRTMQAEDVSANALGVMLGLMVLVALERLIPSWRTQTVNLNAG